MVAHLVHRVAAAGLPSEDMMIKWTVLGCIRGQIGQNQLCRLDALAGLREASEPIQVKLHLRLVQRNIYQQAPTCAKRTMMHRGGVRIFFH